jgi:hypothetical protein
VSTKVTAPYTVEGTNISVKVCSVKLIEVTQECVEAEAWLLAMLNVLFCYRTIPK